MQGKKPNASRRKSNGKQSATKMRPRDKKKCWSIGTTNAKPRRSSPRPPQRPWSRLRLPSPRRSRTDRLPEHHKVSRGSEYRHFHRHRDRSPDPPRSIQRETPRRGVFSPDTRATSRHGKASSGSPSMAQNSSYRDRQDPFGLTWPSTFARTAATRGRWC